MEQILPARVVISVPIQIPSKSVNVCPLLKIPFIRVNANSAHLRNLTELALLYCHRIGDVSLLEVGQGCKFLQVLHLVDCSSIGDDAMCSIGKTFEWVVLENECQLQIPVICCDT
ncbi:hypothetical protein PHAVU_007G006301 [Phaseolus vulgaris]